MELQTAKGVRDVPPDELIMRNSLVGKLQRLFESYGFNPLETPMIERLDVLNVKFGAGEDSDVAKEIFRLKDQGNRELGLRYELTLSMCRFIAMNPALKFPFKRYEMGRVYRDGPIKTGRSREFMQCDVDIVGSGGMASDAECILLALDAFEMLGLDAYIEVNNRKLLDGILEYSGIPEQKRKPSMIALDKLKKAGLKGVTEELQNLGIKDSAVERLMTFFSVLNLEGSIVQNSKELLKVLNNERSAEALKEIQELYSFIPDSKQSKLKFNPLLARGLGYYTGTVFEGFLSNSEIKSSICGGGRYDELIMKLMGSKQKVPAVGISFGLVPIMESMKNAKVPRRQSVTQVFIAPIGNVVGKCFEIAETLRKSGLNVEMDLMGRGPSKNLAYAGGLGIKFVLLVGEDELKSGKFKLRNMQSGDEVPVDLKQIKKIVNA